jgi:hypothetical protein
LNAKRLKEAQAELSEQYAIVRRAQARIAVLQKQIKGYDALEEAFELESNEEFNALPICLLDEVGLTEACSSMVRSSSVPLTAVDVRDRLLASNYTLSGYVNALATIHVTLDRLAAAGRLHVDSNDEGKKVFSVPTLPRIIESAQKAAKIDAIRRTKRGWK